MRYRVLRALVFDYIFKVILMKVRNIKLDLVRVHGAFVYAPQEHRWRSIVIIYDSLSKFYSQFKIISYD